GAALRVAGGALALMIDLDRPVPTPVGQLTPLLRLSTELVAQGAQGVPPQLLDGLGRLAAGSGEAARLARALITSIGDGARAAGEIALPAVADASQSQAAPAQS